MRESWSDARLDDLNGKVDEHGRRMDDGLNRTDAHLHRLRDDMKVEFAAFRGEMNERFDKADRRFDGIDERLDRRFDEMQNRLDATHRLMIQFCGTALAALLGFIATQL